MAESEDLHRLLEAVQTQLAYQEDTIQTLNDSLAQQQQEVLLLRRQLELLKQRQDEQSAGADAHAALEKPPHY